MPGLSVWRIWISYLSGQRCEVRASMRCGTEATTEGTSWKVNFNIVLCSVVFTPRALLSSLMSLHSFAKNFPPLFAILSAWANCFCQSTFDAPHLRSVTLSDVTTTLALLAIWINVSSCLSTDSSIYCKTSSSFIIFCRYLSTKRMCT